MQTSKARPIAVVTGASSGLGRDFAREAAVDGHDLVLIARTEAPMRELATRLQATYGTTVHVVVGDLAVPGAGEGAARDVAALGVEPTAAFQPGPNMAVYCATKAYVLSFGEALAYEVRGTGVSVTTVCPGATKTNFQKNAAIDEASSVLLRSGMMSSAEVARLGYRGMKSGTSVVVTGIPNLIGATVARHMPHALVVPMAAKILSK